MQDFFDPVIDVIISLMKKQMIKAKRDHASVIDVSAM